MLKLAYYQTSSDRSPVEEYINSQNDDTRARIKAVLLAFCEEFPEVTTVSIKHLRNKLWEIRIPDALRRQHRILYVVVSDCLVVLHAFTKKTRRTPANEIRLALRRLREVLS